MKTKRPAPMTGYVACNCRDCFEIAIGLPGKALCGDCEEAGCEAGADRECMNSAHADENEE